MLRGVMRLRFPFLFNLVLAGVALALCSGCGVSTLRDQREDRDPQIRRAREMKNAGNIEGALEAYQRALDKKPQLARAHLEMGLLYDRDLNDYVRAVYHYERYLELRPDAENREMIQAVADQARISFATTLPEMPNGAIREISRLKQENAELRAWADRQRAAPPSSSAPAATSTRLPEVSAPAAPIAPIVRTADAAAPAAPSQTTYVVMPGDTLSRIAGKVYGDSKKWTRIYDANRAALRGGPQSIKVGQTLVIPK